MDRIFAGLIDTVDWYYLSRFSPYNPEVHDQTRTQMISLKVNNPGKWWLSLLLLIASGTSIKHQPETKLPLLCVLDNVHYLVYYLVGKLWVQPLFLICGLFFLNILIAPLGKLKQTFHESYKHTFKVI